MNNYVTAAINTIYEGEDDHIVIGLTGRTGSGCSTVAKILQMQTNDLKHSLYRGDNPSNNSERKERIIFRHFEKTWVPFQLIQVRSVITLSLFDDGLQPAIDFITTRLGGEDELISSAASILSDLYKKFEEISKNPASANILDFYNIFLPKKSDDLKIALGEKFIVPLYQDIGKNIRLSGSPFDSTTINGKFFNLVQKVSAIIRKIIDANRELGRKSLIVVDALRNPLEAIYLQDRITNFHLVAVSCSNEERLARLAAQNFSISEINAIDKIEYSNRDLEIESTYSMQDIQGCLQRADIYLSNPNGGSYVEKFIFLTNQLIRITSLIKRPGIVTPTALERCMQIAYTAKLNSGCISRQVGALVTDKNFSIKAIGWNDTPKGQVPCNLRNRGDLLHGNDSAAFSNFEKNDTKYIDNFTLRSPKYIKIASTGRNISYCFKTEFNSMDGKSNQVHTRSLHAEENAFLQISKYGGSGIEGGFLFTTASPCELCAKKAYQLGLKKIFYIDPYPGISLSHIIEGGSENPYMELFSGAIGRSFHKLYSPIMAYKDELHALAVSEHDDAVS
jgi:deoxycytidylate deaminase/dephospho-CoA kinase